MPDSTICRRVSPGCLALECVSLRCSSLLMGGRGGWRRWRRSIASSVRFGGGAEGGESRLSLAQGAAGAHERDDVQHADGGEERVVHPARPGVDEDGKAAPEEPEQRRRGASP